MKKLSRVSPDTHHELTSSGFSALLSAAADAIVIINNQGKILNFNCAAEKLFGYSIEEVENNNVKILMPEPYCNEHDGYLNRYNTTKVPRIIGIGRKVEAQRKDSSIFPIELSVGEYVEGGNQYFVGIIRDLTDREKVENDLRDSQDRLQERELALDETIKNAPIGILTTKTDGQIQSVNHAACELLGFSESEFLQMNYTQLIHHEDIDTTEERRQSLLDGNDPSFSLNARCIRKDGNIVYAVLHCRVIWDPPDHEPSRLVAQLVDRTDQVQAEQEARRMQERLAHVDRISTMGEMASGIAHEINQPLTAISSYVQACQRRLQSGQIKQDKLRELLNKIDTQSQRAGTIVQRIRSLMKSHDWFRERVEINDLISDIIPLVKADTNSKGFLISVEFITEPCEVIVDRVQIQQVILNLVRNAIDATEEADLSDGKICIRTKIVEQGDYVEISVRDFGIGIPEQVQDQIFEPFVTSKQKGTGMGLSISRSIVTAHGGILRSQRKNPGSLFYFTLPIAVGDSDG